jgi:hypothetical protein
MEIAVPGDEVDGGPDEGAVDAAEITDEELTALALAADPDAPVGDDAQPFSGGVGPSGLLPGWYMPAAATGSRGRTRRVVVAGLIGAFLLVNGAGLCVTYGFPEIAW